MRRKIYVLVLVLAVLAMLQRPVYAMTATIPWGDSSGDFAYCAGKHKDAYSAAAELAGYDLSALTQEQRTALLDVNGDYVAYGQLAERLSTLSQITTDFSGAVGSFFNVNGWLEIMGLDEIWVYRAHNDDLIDQAALDIRDCINEHPRATGNPDPGGGGGSGGSGGESEYYVFNMVCGITESTRSNTRLEIYDTNGNLYTNQPLYTNTQKVIPQNISIYIPKSCFDNIQVSNLWCNLVVNSGSTLKINIYNGTGLSYTYDTTTVDGNNRTYVSRIDYTEAMSSGIISFANYTFDGTNLYINTTDVIGINNSQSSNYQNYSFWGAVSNSFTSDIDTPTYTPTLPQYPDNDIPDPTNITLPNITLPNITLPNLTLPTVQPSNPTYNTYTYNTYQRPTGTDYIPYLNNIIDWLAEIDLDTVSGLNALGDIMDGVNTQIRQQVKWLFDSLDVELDAGVTAINTTIRTMIDGLAGLINDAFEDSFYDLKVWLKDALTKIKNEVSDFDDDMLYQLKLIRRKMGGGRSSEPSPKEEPDDWLKWWSDLIADLLGKLADALPDELLELVEDFKALGQKFPFSIPWDIAFLVGLFAHAPVTPVFDYPVPYGYVNGELLVANVHVDLSPWDNVALAIRNAQLVGFAIWLAFNTSKLSTYLKLPGSKKGE